MNLTVDEFILFATLCSIIFGILVLSYSKKGAYHFFSPLTFHAATLTYYAVLGPLFALIYNHTALRLVEHRGYIGISWAACLVSLISLLLGFYCKRKISLKHKITTVPSDTKVRKICLRIFFIAFLAYVILMGVTTVIQKLNFLTAHRIALRRVYTGPLGNYLWLAMNMFVVPVLVLFTLFIRKKVRLLFIVPLLIAVSLYITDAFRYRLVILLLGLISTYHLCKKMKPRPIITTVLLLVFISFMGLMELTRGYGRGLRLGSLQRRTGRSYLQSGLNETHVFQATGYLIDYVSHKSEFTGFDFLYNAVCAPIPRLIWPEKPDGSYLLDMNTHLYGKHGGGQAYLYYGEYFLSFGWMGVIVLSFLLGVFYKTMWLYFLINKEHPFAIVAISVFNGFVYIVVSRGYLSQQLTLFFFTVCPIFFIIRYFNKRARRVVYNNL